MRKFRFWLIAAVCVSPVMVRAAESLDATAFERFGHFLEQSLQKQPDGAKDAADFYQQAFAFWHAHLQDYLVHPDRYRSLLSVYYQSQAVYPLHALLRDGERFKDEIENFRRWDAKNTFPSNAVLLVGSSSVVLWESSLAFSSFPVINRGFGGSMLADLNRYYDDIVKKYKPAIIVLYCDNDIFFGKAPSVALQLFEEFANRVAADLPTTELLFLSMKPQLMDDFAGKDVRHNQILVNQMIKDFIETRKRMRFVDVATPMYRDGKLRSDIFVADGVHLNARGYDLWNPIVEKHLSELYKENDS